MGNPEKWIWKFWSATIFPSKFAMQTQWNTAIHILGAHTIKNLCQKCESNPSILLTTQEWLQFSQRCRMCFISCLSFSHVLLEHAKIKVTDFHWSRSLSPFLLIPFFLEFFSILLYSPFQPNCHTIFFNRNCYHSQNSPSGLCNLFTTQFLFVLGLGKGKLGCPILN